MSKIVDIVGCIERPLREMYHEVCAKGAFDQRECHLGAPKGSMHPTGLEFLS